MPILGILIQSPWLALIPAIGFGILGDRTRRVLPWVAAVLWLLYAGYEEGMRRRILCTGECNIRVDLLLIYPVLIILSVMAAMSRRRGKT